MPLDLAGAIVVDFPLRGEWRATSTPAQRVPSHGTDYFGQRFAFDFVQMDPEGTRYYPRGFRQHLFGRLPAAHFYCWNQPVHSAFDGRVIAVGDGWPDRTPLNAFWEILRVTFAPTGPSGSDYRPLAGNFVLIEGSDGIGFYGHLRAGSIWVETGQWVTAGDVVGNVGNSGNSTMPHLHFHMMDGPDPLQAAGLLCAFRSYDRFIGDGWTRVQHGVPAVMERVRYPTDP